MQERQVTIGGTTHPLPKPFFVMATQNPVEQEGTYPLPEAQTDRFLFKLIVDYPTADEEATMMQRWGQVTQQPALQPVSSGEELLELRKAVDQVHVSQAVQAYILSLVRNTRMLADGVPQGKRRLNFGASPRASLALFAAGRALAWLRGQDFLSPALVQELAPDVLRHRIGLTYGRGRRAHRRQDRRRGRRKDARPRQVIARPAAPRFPAPHVRRIQRRQPACLGQPARRPPAAGVARAPCRRDLPQRRVPLGLPRTRHGV